MHEKSEEEKDEVMEEEKVPEEVQQSNTLSLENFAGEERKKSETPSPKKT